MSANVQGRKWFLTINNPEQAGLTHDVILDKIATLHSIQYMCMADEVGAKGTPHTHLYILSSSNIRFNTLKRRFPVADIEKAFGSSQQSRDYIRKEGKYADSKKAETRVEGSFYEEGEFPKDEKEEDYPDILDIIDRFESGDKIRDVIKDKPGFALKVSNLEKLKEHLQERYLEFTRSVKVTLIFDDKGQYDLSEIFDREGYNRVCLITEYPIGKGLFDPYDGQDVVVFTDFTGQIPITTMNRYLDGYPKYLPARFHDRIACYTKVIIITSSTLSALYDNPHQAKAKSKFISMIDEYIDLNSGEISFLKEEIAKGENNDGE